MPEQRDPKIGRQNEIEELTRLKFNVTYIAPKKDSDWKNWYVISGVNSGTEFYFRRWYCEDSIVSIEFRYPKELAPLLDKLIPTMTHEFAFSNATPKIDP
jgi:hypothetical protein